MLTGKVMVIPLTVGLIKKMLLYKMIIFQTYVPIVKTNKSYQN